MAQATGRPLPAVRLDRPPTARGRPPAVSPAGETRWVGQLLDRIDRAISEALGRVHTLNRSGDEMCPQAQQLAHQLVIDQDPWINYAASRLDAANIAYLALGRAR